MSKTPIRTTENARVANQIVRAAEAQKLEYEIHPDDADGTTGFMLRLGNGLLLLAELSAGGVLSGGAYDDRGTEGKQVQFIHNATVSQMLELIRPDLDKTGPGTS